MGDDAWVLELGAVILLAWFIWQVVAFDTQA